MAVSAVVVGVLAVALEVVAASVVEAVVLVGGVPRGVGDDEKKLAANFGTCFY